MGSFSKFGEIGDVYIPRDRYTGDNRGFGFVRFLVEADAEEAIREMDGKDVDGNTINASLAKEKRPDFRGGRGGGRGGYDRRDDRRGGGYHDRRDDRRGGYDDRRGGYGDRRGGYDDRRGGYDDRRGGYDDRRDDRRRGEYSEKRRSRSRSSNRD